MNDLRYAPIRNGQGKFTRKSNPNCWVTGPDPIRRDKYYAWLKHKAQAKFRKEEYTITWEEFEDLWKDNEMWFSRGRNSQSLCMSLIDWKLGWTIDNVEIIRRIEQLRKPKHNDE